jgi:hypothetical protein
VKKGTVKIRGIRSPIPTGHLIGRTDKGDGDGHMIKAGRALALGNKRLDVTLSGDVEINQKGDATVVGLQGVPVANTAPTLNDVLAFNGTEWEPAVGGSGSGDVVGPASATDNHIAQFDGVTGKLLKDGGLSSASFDAAGDADAAIAILNGGTTGQVLTKDSNADLDFSWQAGGGGGSSTPSWQFQISPTTSGAHSFATTGNLFTPQIDMTVTGCAFIITTVTGATYKIGIAPYNTGTNKITSAPSYSGVFTAGTGAANKWVNGTFSGGVALTAGTAYVFFIVRTDSTTTVSTTLNFVVGSGTIYAPGFVEIATNRSVHLASIAPGTGDTWTTETPGWYGMVLSYQM